MTKLAITMLLVWVSVGAVGSNRRYHDKDIARAMLKYEREANGLIMRVATLNTNFRAGRINKDFYIHEINRTGKA